MINNQEQTLEKFKVVLLGDSNVGKSSILERFIYDTWSNQYQPTIGIDFISKTINLDGQNIRLVIWDTGTYSKRARSLIPYYIRDSKAAILCYDIYNLSEVQNFTQIVQKKKEEVMLQSSQLQIKLILTKIGMFNNMLYYECSAKEGTNISTLFKDIAIKLLSETTQTPQALHKQQAKPQQQTIPQQETNNQQQMTSTQPASFFQGDEAVGKTTMIVKLVLNQIIEYYEPTRRIDFLSKRIQVDGQNVRLQMWDTAGKEKFRTLNPSYQRIQELQLQFLMLKSFQNIPFWMDIFMKYCSKDATLVLIANKVDQKQNRVVSEDVGIQFAQDNKMFYYESSLYDGDGITKIFLDLSLKLLGQRQVPQQQQQQG